jgi:hypothetical protein
VERVAGEILVAHDFLVGELVERSVHSLRIALELLFRRLPATFEPVLAVIGIEGGRGREVSPPRFARDRRVLLVERHE